MNLWAPLLPSGKCDVIEFQPMRKGHDHFSDKYLDEEDEENVDCFKNRNQHYLTAFLWTIRQLHKSLDIADQDGNTKNNNCNWNSNQNWQHVDSVNFTTKQDERQHHPCRCFRAGTGSKKTETTHSSDARRKNDEKVFTSLCCNYQK